MSRAAGPGDAEDILEEAEASLLDLLDNLLNRGVVLNGEVMLSLAKVDLVYLRLSVLLCAADRIFPTSRGGPRHGPPHPPTLAAPRPSRGAARPPRTLAAPRPSRGAARPRR